MREVLISIKPKWCELIANGKKTVEVRKTKPKLETPFKVYIYCTNGKETLWVLRKDERAFTPEKIASICTAEDVGGAYKANGKIIGEFVCDCITPLYNVCYDEWERLLGGLHRIEKQLVENACLTEKELHGYAKGKRCYAWHITDLVVYDEPRELSEFYTEGDCDCMNCKKCYWFDRGNGYNVENDCNLAYKCVELHKSFKPIIRPPQSWCYIEPRQTAD